MTCTDEDKKCKNREEFYGKKLDRILALQKKRFGGVEDNVILFPIPLSKTLQKLSSTSNSKDNPFLQMTQTSMTKKNSRVGKASRRIRTEPNSMNNTSSFFAARPMQWYDYPFYLYLFKIIKLRAVQIIQGWEVLSLIRWLQ